CAVAPVANVTLTGSLHSIAVDGGSLWIADSASTPDAGANVGAFDVAAASTDCANWMSTFTKNAVDPSPLGADDVIVPLDLVSTASGVLLYYELFALDASQPFGLRGLGTGLAIRDVATGHFTPTSDLLWSPDRPTYGQSALVVGSDLFVWGCQGVAPLDDACFVAKASANPASAASYSYWNGLGWSSNADDAVAIVHAGGSVSVRVDPSRSSAFLMTYVPPLGDTLVVRSSLAPEGPWSGPITLARCSLDGANGNRFCAGGEQHPELASTAATLALTYDAVAFESDGGFGPPTAPVLANVPVPSSLP
ncbi:MAG: hypothetical protein ACREJX_01270, partial [Polyangiaceae bacterium]